MSTLKMTILGCGTSTGVPVPGCPCPVCRSGTPGNQRFRPSGLIHGAPQGNILIDATTDLRSQALRFGVERVDAVLYTHAHADHILGTDDLRVFNFVSKSSIPCFGDGNTLQALRSTFKYIFEPDPDYLGGMLAQLTLHEVAPLQPFTAAGVEIIPLPLRHGRMPVLGYRVGNLAYATDCNFVPEETKNALRGVEVLILDALRFKPHRTHFTIPESIALAAELGIKRTIFTHMTHDVDFYQVSATLPPNVQLAQDGLEIVFQG